MLKQIISFAHELILQAVEPGETIIDATCGNGHDTVVLSKAVGVNGQVLAFDIQKQALRNTKQLLDKQDIRNVTLIHASHENIRFYLHEEDHGTLSGAIFNLGYLPGSDKSVITNANSTIKAMDTIVDFLKPGGLIVLVVYHGHPGGDEEKESLLKYLRTFNQKHFNVLKYGFINQKNHPPFILAVEKKK
ncbi:methyltransferase domain-containing protein [Aquibacillus sp. 3ASR75-11]|uniref:Methyltransferase domain-containing protein n=1 Tax=Terrihalobacillus insolitus TaxID=2950438 RepID=A0A9X4AKI8_9BACI|nr:class I SAM-dependent methyltransferase [Terrihalobacillus insolitus]MDC3412418.1 methyltransferase domain-containing protein [Terrihalobacillus insolitus]MDC3422889.1 methyltransferase domain-containing protein [Terrihalobacillus insolitus]